MALRATTGPAPSTRSAKAGDVVTFSAKVENSTQAEASLLLAVEELKEGALGRSVGFAFSFDPPMASVRARSRSVVEFRWRAALPEGKDAFTFRGKLALRAADGKLVGSAPLDLYVSSS